MLKKINFESLYEDWRKIGVTFFIAGLMGLFIGPPEKILSLSSLMVLGVIFWYLGLSDGENAKKSNREILEKQEIENA